MVSTPHPRTSDSASLLHGLDALELALEAVEPSVVVALQVPADKALRREPTRGQQRSHPIQQHALYGASETLGIHTYLQPAFDRLQPFQHKLVHLNPANKTNSACKTHKTNVVVHR